MTGKKLIIASPHRRHDSLPERLRERLPGRDFVRIRARSELVVEALDRVDPEFIFLPHWSWRIPADVHAKYPCVVFHMTDVPYGRGGSPLQNLIVRGHERTVLSALRCVEQLDAGPVYLKRGLELEGTAEEILRRASGIIEDMIVEIVLNRPVPRPQEGSTVEFARRRPEQGDLEQAQSLKEAFDLIRMLDGEGYPPAFLDTTNLRLEFTGAREQPDFVEATVQIRRKST